MRHRRWKPCFTPALCRLRNAIARMVGRRKAFRRIATRDDKLAYSFLTDVQLVAVVRC